MPASMTAFAARETALDAGAIAWELRSVNHRYLEVQPRLPDSLRALESEVRERIGAVLAEARGVALAVALGPLDGNDGVGPLRNGRAGHNLHAGSGLHVGLRHAAGRNFAGYVERCRKVGEVVNAHGVAIHRRVVERRNGVATVDGRRESASEGIAEGNGFGRSANRLGDGLKLNGKSVFKRDERAHDVWSFSYVVRGFWWCPCFQSLNGLWILHFDLTVHSH